MRIEGLEPTPVGLKDRNSTTELNPHDVGFLYPFCYLSIVPDSNWLLEKGDLTCFHYTNDANLREQMDSLVRLCFLFTFAKVHMRSAVNLRNKINF